ncbi:unnamed protein product [Rotaria sp. Silwood1]|nr:unnamed protein product [Rotaria sp. Silwood1]
MNDHPLNEEFMLLSNNRKQPSSTPSSSTSLIVINRISTLHSISSTTCKTKTILENSNYTMPSIGDHLGKQVSNEPNSDNDIETSSKQTRIDDDSDEIESFMKVDDAVLSIQLVSIGFTVDGSGETTEETTEGTSDLPNNTIVIMTINCTNASDTLFYILTRINTTIPFTYIVSPNYNQLTCNGTSVDVTLNFNTTDNINTINELYENLENITSSVGVPLVTFNKCGRNETEPVINVTSCFLINLCRLCGTPPRGVCLPEDGVSKCKCFVNTDDPSRPYVGDRCLPADPIKLSTAPRWTPIIIGIIAGLASLCCAITCCLWTIAIWRRRRNLNKDELRIFRLWHLPRAQIPTSGTQENVPTYRPNTPSTYSSNRTESDQDPNNTADSAFFKELDQKMGENLRATRTRPNASAILASLPSDTISTISSNDSIDELDAIIDNEDLNLTFHDSLDDLYEDNEILEAVNPNVKLPRPNVDSKPSGLFSKFLIEQLTSLMKY